MKIDDALRKIKKCLALRKDASADPSMAAAAMRQAQALMAEFKVASDDARLTDVATERCTARTAAQPRWENGLAVAIAQAFGCETIWSSERRWLGHRSVKKSVLVFVGIAAAPKVAGYAWDVLSRQCAKARLAHIRAQPRGCKPITLTARGDRFAEGWVVAATEHLTRLAGEAAEKLLIANYMKASYPGMTTGEALDRGKGRSVSTNDFHQGVRAGEAAQLHHGRPSSQRGLLT